MKKLIMLAMALVLCLGLAVVGVSAADELVLDISTLTEDKADANGAWVYIHADHRLEVHSDIVLTGKSDALTVAPMDDVQITLRNASIATPQGVCTCYCEDYDVFCGKGVDTVIVLEGENTVVNDFYIFYSVDNNASYVIKGEGSLDVVLPENTNAGEEIAVGMVDLQGGSVFVDAPVYVFNMTINGGSFAAAGGLSFFGEILEINAGSLEAEYISYSSSQAQSPAALTVNGGTVKADCIDYYTEEYSDGIVYLEINGGEVITSCYTYEDGDSFAGVYSDDGDLYVNGGSLKATYIEIDGNMEVNGGSVYAEGFTDENGEPYPAIAVYRDFYMTDGCVMLKGVELPEDIQEEMGYTPTVSLIVIGSVTIDESLTVVEGDGPKKTTDGDVCFIGGDAHICAPYAITVKAENGEVKAPEKAAHGQKITLEVTANENYELDYVTVNGEKIEGTSFEMPYEDVEVKAVFKVKNVNTGDMNILFALAVMSVAVITATGIKKIKSM